MCIYVCTYKGLRLRIWIDSIFVTNQVFILELRWLKEYCFYNDCSKQNKCLQIPSRIVYRIKRIIRVQWFFGILVYCILCTCAMTVNGMLHTCVPQLHACVPQLHTCTRTVNNIIASYLNSLVEEFITKVASVITNLNVFTK